MFNKKILVILYFVLIFFSNILLASNDGNYLLSNCQSVLDKSNGVIIDERGIINYERCLSYLNGFGGADALSPMKRKGKKMFCVPKGKSLREVAVVVVNWLKVNEEKLHYGQHEVLAMALIVNFPCRK